MTDQDINGLYIAMGLKIPLEVPDDQQTCQVGNCMTKAMHTTFLEHKDVNLQLRLWLCSAHHASLLGVKPVGARVLFPNRHLESITMDERHKAKEALTGQIHMHCLENMTRPTKEVAWSWTWIEFDISSGQRIKGTELLGTVPVERIEMESFAK